MKKITLAEAYEMAVSAIPGASNNAAFNVCRDEVRSNLARIFEDNEDPKKDMRYVEKSGDNYVENPVESEGKDTA